MTGRTDWLPSLLPSQLAWSCSLRSVSLIRSRGASLSALRRSSKLYSMSNSPRDRVRASQSRSGFRSSGHGPSSPGHHEHTKLLLGPKRAVSRGAGPAG